MPQKKQGRKSIRLTLPNGDYISRECFQSQTTGKEAASVADVLGLVVKKLRKQHGGGVMAVLRREWPQIAGERYAAHSRVSAVRQGVLHVTVDSAACLHEMANFAKPEIYLKIKQNPSGKGINKIEFKQGVLERE